LKHKLLLTEQPPAQQLSTDASIPTWEFH